MLQIPLAALPNQRLAVRLDGRVHDLWLRAAGDLTLIDVVRDGEPLVQGQRVVPGTPVVPYAYRVEPGGNLYLLTDGNQYPDWRRFGVTDFLLYATPDEL